MDVSAGPHRFTPEFPVTSNNALYPSVVFGANGADDLVLAFALAAW